MPNHPIRVGVVFGAAQRLRGACALVAHLARQQQDVAVYCPQEEQLAEFDRLLWEYETSRFVPHVTDNHPYRAQTPVVLHRNLPAVGSLLVVNLGDTPIDLTSGYPWIFEVVGADPTELARGRSHWRHYQAAGCQLQAFDLNRNQLP